MVNARSRPRSLRAPHLVVASAALLACQPEFSGRYSHVEEARVLGVQSEPAQAAPSGAVSYRILVAAPEGTVPVPDVRWTYCTQGKATSELNDVAPACFGSGDEVVPFGAGAEASGIIPIGACRDFGPDIPQSKPGEPPGRPTDADATGGYYQPVVAAVSTSSKSLSVLAETRLTCGLANSSSAVLEDFQKRTKPNENPELLRVAASSLGDLELTDEASATPLAIDRAAKIDLRASWPSCPASPVCGDGICGPLESKSDCPDDCSVAHGCRGAEPYAYLDPARRSLVDRHESMRVSWFTTAGEFTDDHTGRLESEFDTTFSDNTWTAPAEPGPAFIWVVLRDDRGGVDWKTYRIFVR
jgi:hypothetical protein